MGAGRGSDTETCEAFCRADEKAAPEKGGLGGLS